MSTIVITGASGNIGSVIAEYASNEFDQIILGGRDTEKLNHLREKIEAKSNCKAICFSADISKYEVCNEVLNRILPKNGVNALVHTAAIRSDVPAPLSDTDIYHWERIIKVNLLGTYYILKVIIPYLRKASWARVVLLSSSVAEIGLPKGSAYAASKAGVSNLVKTLTAEEGEHGILVNGILPGPVEIDDSHFDENYYAFRKKYYDDMLSRIPLGRLATPDEVAHLALFLASRENTYITGQNIHISGGLI
jgi:NAD(P)-dependent dehydrogenase (short-subunit alcohol dehydrogenase family)